MRLRSLVALSAALVAFPSSKVNAQHRAQLGPEWSTLAATAADLRMQPAAGLPQAARLPVYDDAGALIPYGAVAELVDPSGLGGAFWGAVAFAVAGLVISEGVSPSDCDRRSGGYQYFCSPRQESLRSNLPWALALSFGSLGAWFGYNADRTTWDEALEHIRAQRRAGTR